MEKDKEIHSDREHNNQPKVWMLPGVDYPQNFYTRAHELDVAALFVACYPHVTHWDSQWGELEKETLNIPHYKVNYDARMVLNGRVYLWEVDRGTEDFDQLFAKVDKYIQFSKSLPPDSFQVIFTMQKYRRSKVKNRANKLLEYLASKKHRNQFLVVMHDEVLENPLGAVYVSPLNPMAKCLLASLT